MVETQEENFAITLPVNLSKSSDGDWRVRGLASTNGKDQQGEFLLQSGMDLTPIDMKKGVINYDHQMGPENTIGVLDGYSQTKEGLFLEGRLFKEHDKAKSVHQILKSLKKEDAGRMGMSVEGAILKRNAQNPKIIEKCRIHAVALTMNPVNASTHVDLIKSLSATDTTLEFDIDSIGADEEVFTKSQVVDLVQKALGLAADGSTPPNERSGGDALAPSDLKADEEDTKTKKLKPLTKEQFKKSLITVLDQLQILHPDCSRSVLWEALNDRLQTQFTIEFE